MDDAEYCDCLFKILLPYLDDTFIYSDTVQPDHREQLILNKSHKTAAERLSVYINNATESQNRIYEGRFHDWILRKQTSCVNVGEVIMSM